jgi:hypothetical protein
MTTTHAIYELFEPLLGGVPVRILSDGEVRDIDGFWATVRARGITRLLLVPSLLQACLELEGFVAPPLKVLVLMGEHVAVRGFRREYPGPLRVHAGRPVREGPRCGTQPPALIGGDWSHGGHRSPVFDDQSGPVAVFRLPRTQRPA